MQLQTVQGIRYGKWFAGIGAGLDYYHMRTIPLFLDIRREFFNKKNAPFLYADGGYNFAWARDRDKSEWSNISFDGGLFYDVGLGYRIGTASKQNGFLISAGYSFKYLRESHASQVCINWNKKALVTAKDGLYQFDYTNENNIKLISTIKLNKY